jgi:phospholipid/cholesterol/gamma-HCH transport system substrate-binding protein
MDAENRSLEIGTGLFVLLGFAALAFLTTQLPSSGLRLHAPGAGFEVTARFDNVGDLKVGAPVTMAGVRIGQVDRIVVDPKEYKAIVRMQIDRRFQEIPDDSFAVIQTSGLLGAKYVGIDPGGSPTYLAAGGTIQNTQSAIVLESLINKLFASMAGQKDENGNTGIK